MEALEALMENEKITNDVDYETVNHPSHYCQEGSAECIEEMLELYGIDEVMSFCKLNLHKYRKRALFKNGLEDIKKSDWYYKTYIELKRKKENM